MVTDNRETQLRPTLCTGEEGDGLGEEAVTRLFTTAGLSIDTTNVSMAIIKKTMKTQKAKKTKKNKKNKKTSSPRRRRRHRRR